MEILYISIAVKPVWSGIFNLIPLKLFDRNEIHAKYSEKFSFPFEQILTWRIVVELSLFFFINILR